MRRGSICFVCRRCIRRMSARPRCAHCRSRGGGRPRVRSDRLPKPPRAIRTMGCGARMSGHFRSGGLIRLHAKTVVLRFPTRKNCPPPVLRRPSLNRLRSQHLIRRAAVRHSERRMSVKHRSVRCGSVRRRRLAKRSFRPDAVCRCDSFPPASVRLRCRIPVRPRDLPSGARTLPLYLQD